MAYLKVGDVCTVVKERDGVYFYKGDKVLILWVENHRHKGRFRYFARGTSGINKGLVQNVYAGQLRKIK